MMRSPFRVVLDANVLFPFSLRDTLLRAAHLGYYQLHWSATILEEARRNLVARGHMREDQAERLFAEMERAFPEAAVEDYEALIPAMENDEKDRHVAAAALRAGAQVIVTFNIKDFRRLPPGLEAQTPATFLRHLLDLDPPGMITLLQRQALALQRPPKSFEELLAGLEKTVPAFVEDVRGYLSED